MNKIPTIQELKSKGYLIKIEHFRISDRDWRQLGKKQIKKNYGLYLYGNNVLEGSLRSPCGGKTHLIIIDPKGRKVETTAFCSVNEQFCRKKAVNICLGRAMNQLNFPDEG